MQIGAPPGEPALRRKAGAEGLGWIASLVASFLTAVWVFDSTAGAAQRVARLMEMARPACSHTRISNEDLHDLVQHELAVSASKSEALQAIIAQCREGFRTSAGVGGRDGSSGRSSPGHDG